MIVYKYLSANIAKLVLENSSIRCTQPAALNDPFESVPNLSQYREKTEEKATKVAKELFEKEAGYEVPDEILSQLVSHTMLELNKHLENFPNVIGESMLMLCLTKKNNNSLMWSHYADSHKGIAIGFDSESQFLKHNNGKVNSGLREVKYSEERENGLISLDAQEIERLFFTKSLDWKYEEELRIYYHPSGADDDTKEFEGFKLYLFKFPKECVKEIVFGYKISEQNRNEIAEMVSKTYSEVELFETRLNDTKFNLDVISLKIH
jgi:Protein of unknown function (DUF2971)